MNQPEAKLGRPKGTTKGITTVTPSLRISKADWEAMKLKYPGKVNAMFKAWVKNNLK